MRLILQRVTRASVHVDGALVGGIDRGLLILVGVHANDVCESAVQLADKCIDLRLFEDEEGKMNRSLIDVNGHALLVSQFTLYGDCRKGRRPSFTDAARPDKARECYERFVTRFRERVHRVETGVFGAHMLVELVNDGPVTLILDYP